MANWTVHFALFLLFENKYYKKQYNLIKSR